LLKLAKPLHKEDETKTVTMKFKFIPLIVALIATTGFISNAQKSSAIIKAGLNLANVSVNKDGDVDDSKTLTSFHVGLTGDITLTSFLSFQPGILFTGKGAKTEVGNSSDATYYKATSNPYYIEIPVNLVFKAPMSKDAKFFVGAGPYLGIGVAGKNKVEGKYLGVVFENENDIDFSNDDPTTLNYEEGAGFGIMRRFDFGLNGTAGLEGKSMLFSVNYGLGLAKLQSGTDNSADNANKHRVLSFTIGLKL
jgi:outer membrane protein with beta-barrel domain